MSACLVGLPCFLGADQSSQSILWVASSVSTDEAVLLGALIRAAWGIHPRNWRSVSRCRAIALSGSWRCGELSSSRAWYAAMDGYQLFGFDGFDGLQGSFPVSPSRDSVILSSLSRSYALKLQVVSYSNT